MFRIILCIMDKRYTDDYPEINPEHLDTPSSAENRA